ncbi:Bcr/CflA family efflux MFS transporter [Pseudomonas sp. UM16]|uniref:Bcr/CflA family efflux MFS transporter n=1 Tax=Pseudomonas sp. UM16 TaxID=3158962 RepID=UPI00398FC9AE
MITSPSTIKKTNPERAIALLLIMSLLGVFPLDVILPSFPALSIHFEVDTTHIAYSISLFALSVAAAQLVLGPLSDKIGRKRLLLLGLLTSIVGAVGCVMSTHYLTFIGFRILQAVGCGCFVLTQALVQDLFEGKQRNAMRILQTSASGLFISLSPLTGSWLQQAFDWPGSFITFTQLACIALLMSLFLLRDDTHKNTSKVDYFAIYRTLVHDREFVAYSVIAAIAFTCHFSFIVVSPLLFIDQLGLSPHDFAQVFVLYAIAFVVGGLVAGCFNQRLSTSVQILIGLGLIVLAGLMMVVGAWAQPQSLMSILIPMIVATTGTTLARPAATSCALALQQTRVGAAASMINTLVLAVGAAGSGVITLFSEQVATSLGIGFMLLATGSMLLLPRYPHRPLDPAC